MVIAMEYRRVAAMVVRALFGDLDHNALNFFASTNN